MTILIIIFGFLMFWAGYELGKDEENKGFTGNIRDSGVL